MQDDGWLVKSFGLSQSHGHGSRLVCEEVALTLVEEGVENCEQED